MVQWTTIPCHVIRVLGDGTGGFRSEVELTAAGLTSQSRRQPLAERSLKHVIRGVLLLGRDVAIDANGVLRAVLLTCGQHRNLGQRSGMGLNIVVVLLVCHRSPVHTESDL